TDRRDSRQSKGKSRSKSRCGRLKCYICQSEDHLKRNCPKNNHKKSTGYANKDDQPSSSGSIYDGSEVMMVMSVEALLDRIMDSGGSYHMTPMLDLFYDFLECDEGMILLGDNMECKIRGTLEKEGYTVKMQSGKIKVINGSRVVLCGTRKDNCVYSLDGHAVAGKSHRVSFGVGRHTTQGVIDYVHSDLWGPSQVESLGGKRYFLSIVDDYSRRVWVYILRFKHEAFGKFKEWKQLVGNQTGRTVKKVRTDNGLEFWYPEGVKGYRLYRLDDESPKIVTSRNVVFNESFMYKDKLKDLGACTDNSVEELQVEVELQGLINYTLEEDQEDGDDEDAGDQETDQTPDLTNYQVVRDREPRTRTKPLRFQDETNMAASAF
ncbi:retrotransposon protein, putative, ty1-copia subclass, partial [Tanacetum coccineum]